ncbi:Hsp20/alpha crystallin family protein [Phenylobacterium sp.]|jgi:HSP20 family molecular chaperone IbpA|uniref:Hsp20/alpha crystallin family protein n=1 Tax=Phenylobacterium sp. TaxID=1871053 RepID=UPI002F4190D8
MNNTAARQDAVAASQDLAVREKKELTGQEKTVPGRFFVPSTDAYETEDGLTLVMEMPGVVRENLDVSLEDGVLTVEGRLDFSKYEGLEPVYTEYNVGHYARSFSLSDKVDQDNIAAKIEDGVLTLTLPKAQAARPRRIAVS